MAKTKEPEGPARPICSSCAAQLEAGGFRVKFKKDAMLHMAKCSQCGMRLPVHDGWILGCRKK